MESQWLAGQLSDHGFQFVLFPYEAAAADSLAAGPSAAMHSSRRWQEQIMTPRFQIPENADVAIHHRSGADPDALAFRYESDGYSIRCFHVMDRLAIVLRANDDQTARLWTKREAVEDIASRLAGDIFQYGEKFRFETEHQAPLMAYGRQKTSPGKSPDELFPVEMIQWWYGDNEFGFGTSKVTPVIGDRYPSSMGVSPAQVFIWFDTFGMKRTGN